MSTDDDMTMKLLIVGQDEASAMLRGLQAEMVKTQKLAASLSASFNLSGAKGGGRSVASDIDAAVKAQGRQVSDALRGVRTVQAAKSGAAKAEDADMARAFRNFRVRSKIKETTLREERQSASKQVAEQLRHDRDIYRMRVRWARAEAEERRRIDAESARRHKAEERAHTALRNRVGSGAHQAVGGIKGAVERLQHPFFTSPAFAAITGLTIAVEVLRRSIEAATTVDTATVKLRMFGPGISAADAAAARSKALRDSVTYGTGAEHLLNIQGEAMRAGVPKVISQAMAEFVPKAAAAMGETAEMLADSMGEAVQQLVGMHQVKTPQDARRFANDMAGMANFGGMTPQKMNEFLASGGLGHGRELGYSFADTLGLASAFGAMGARTGMYDSRMIGQFATIVPHMRDRYMKVLRSRDFGDESRAMRGAPRMLGYGSIDAMIKGIESGPEGLLDWFGRMGKLAPKLQKLILSGFGFNESTGAVIAEMAASPGKARSYIDQARKLDGQKDGADYLTEKWGQWKDSLAFVLKQLSAAFEAIKAEIGDALKDDLIGPFRDAFADFTTALLDGGLRQRFHAALMSFIQGLGFEDAAHMFAAWRSNLGTFDAAGFMKGIGEGLRTVVDTLRSFASALGFVAGHGSAEALGKLTAELLGFSLVAHGLAPVMGIIGALTSTFTALKGVVETLGALRLLAGGAAAAEMTGASVLAAGLLPVSIAAIAVGAIAVTVANWNAIKDWFGSWFKTDKDSKNMPATANPGASSYNPFLFQPNAFKGDTAGLLHPADFTTWDEHGRVGKAIIATSRTVSDLLETARSGHPSTTLAAFHPDDIRPSFMAGGAALAGKAVMQGGSGGAHLPRCNGPLSSIGDGLDSGTTYRSRGGKGMTETGRARVGLWMGFMMHDMGLSRDKAAAMVGMMQGESGLNLNPSGEHWDVNGPSGGTAQWHDVAGRGGRLSQLKAFAANLGKDWHAMEVQQAFWKHEMLSPGFRKAWNAIKNAPDGAAALRAGINLYENPRDKLGEFQKRFPNYARLMHQGEFTAPKPPTAAELAGQVRTGVRPHTGDVHVHVTTNADDPDKHGQAAGEAFRRATQHRYSDIFSL